ncbi:hypothetical protein ABIA39_007533 [Nocardia sp. GAS34]|uniref:hypothetical protein n=1 Tax=unclassified Nocardia TaxID=2637762 RepID=UPI003D24AD41
MTDPSMYLLSDVPAWKIRVLARIHALAADWSATRRRGYEHYSGTEHDALISWRTDLQKLIDQRTDLEARAVAVGIPEPAIEFVRENGYRGQRFADSFPGASTSGNPAREVLIDAVAQDLWDLQQMLVLGAARQHRRFAAGRFTETNIGARARFDRNTVSLWARAGSLAAALQLTETERDRLWVNDIQGWSRIITATVARYGRRELERQWHAHARRDIELATVQNLGDLPTPALGTAARRASSLPPLGQMISAAEQAVAQYIEHGSPQRGAPMATAVQELLPDPEATANPIEQPHHDHGLDRRPCDPGLEL